MRWYAGSGEKQVKSCKSRQEYDRGAICDQEDMSRPRWSSGWQELPTAPVVRRGASTHGHCRGHSRYPLRGLNRTPGPERSMCALSQALQCDLIGRVPELEKRHPPVPRHAIHSDEDLPPTEIGKARDDIIKAAWTALQLIKNCFFYG